MKKVALQLGLNQVNATKYMGDVFELEKKISKVSTTVLLLLAAPSPNLINSYLSTSVFFLELRTTVLENKR